MDGGAPLRVICSGNSSVVLLPFFLHFMLRLSASKGEEMIPRIIQPIAARGGIVHPSMLQLLTLSTMMAAMPAPKSDRVFGFASIQLRTAALRANITRANWRRERIRPRNTAKARTPTDAATDAPAL